MAIDDKRAMQPVEDDSRAPLKIRFDLGGDIAQNFAILSDIYNKLYAWDVMVSRAQLDSIEGTHARQTTRRILAEYATEVPAEDRLRLTESAVTPATYIAVTGAQKPLLTLQRYLVHRHVDWDREAKEPSEDRRLELENGSTPSGSNLIHCAVWGFRRFRFAKLSRNTFRPAGSA